MMIDFLVETKLISHLFEATILLLLAAQIIFVCWWFRDIYSTTLAEMVARKKLQKIGIDKTADGNQQISKMLASYFQNYVQWNSPAEFRKELSIVLGCLYLLRHDFSLSNSFFEQQLSSLNENARSDIAQNASEYIGLEDIRSYLSIEIKPSMAERAANRIGDNLRELIVLKNASRAA